jgi:hypothetical protein
VSKTDNQLKRVRAIKARHEDRLLAKPGVMSVGVGLRQRGGALTNEVCIVVTVRNKRPITNLPPDEVLPAAIEGIPVDVQESDDIVISRQR